MNTQPGLDDCAGCRADRLGATDRLDYRHRRGCDRYDAFYDASDAELLAMLDRGEVG